jgi:alginate O-acetyltransferase complex protein AlgI
MTFDSFTFVVFFAAVLIMQRRVHGEPRKWLLLLTSWMFYAGWNPYFLPLLILTSSFDWLLAKKLMQPHPNRWRWLLLSLVSNLGVLAFFKYRFFIAQNIDLVLGTGLLADLQGPGAHHWTLPVGISFYTFQSLSYCIDAYRNDLAKERVSWLDFSLYVAFFPQLVAGPIVRFGDFYPQLKVLRRADAQGIGSGIALMIVGLFLKTVCADAVFAPVSDALFTGQAAQHFQDAWVATVAFSGQIFCDFAGYSLCAIGCARALGFRLADNFDAPYAAIGFSDFWRRWHISLSTWLRDYLYIPLGGNRFGALRTYTALSLTMLIGGLWHGAAWTFVLWGALHGGYLVLERLARPALAKLPAIWALRWLGGLITLVGVLQAWVFFRAESLAQALQLSSLMWNPPTAAAPQLSAPMKMALCGFVLLVVAHIFQRRFNVLDRLLAAPFWLLACLLAQLLSAIVLSPGHARAFIYFQF